MQSIFQKENADIPCKYRIYRHLQTYEKIIKFNIGFYAKKSPGKFSHTIYYRAVICQSNLLKPSHLTVFCLSTRFKTDRKQASKKEYRL